MPEYLLLMRAPPDPAAEGPWEAYLDLLAAAGRLRGGSALGAGVALRKSGAPAAIDADITGFLRVEAADLDAARALLVGNPVFEAGGVVEIRPLLRDGDPDED